MRIEMVHIQDVRKDGVSRMNFHQNRFFIPLPLDCHLGAIQLEISVGVNSSIGLLFFHHLLSSSTVIQVAFFLASFSQNEKMCSR